VGCQVSLHIETLGSFDVSHGDVPISDSVWKTQKNKTLFKILLTNRGHALNKEHLMDWLWPEMDPDAASRNLRVAISQVRQALEPHLRRGSQSRFLLTTESGYAWNNQADYWLDAAEFESLCSKFSVDAKTEDSERRISDAERAKALYRGDYLEEDRYADWATAERERLREIYFALLTEMAETHARQGRYQQAISLCREVLAADRCRESVGPVDALSLPRRRSSSRAACV
jgi:DNA-binding SARP family transcriptional activator